MNDIADIPNGIYTDTVLPAITADAATAIIAHVMNPFSKSAYINSIKLFPGVEIANSDNNTDTFNLNIQLEATTEIANWDLLDNNGPFEVDAGGYDFTISGSAAQRLIAAGDGLLIQREDSGTSPALVNGQIIRIHWLPRG